MIGSDIGQYHILEQLGQGGMATVYKAWDVRGSREVAVKLIRADQLQSGRADRLLLRFEIEKRLAKLRHPNIVRVIDYGNHNGLPYLVMDFVPGGTLKTVTGRRLPWREAAALLAPIARALDYLHQNDVVHRDVKPSNILMAPSGQPLLSDFGIAKLLQAGDTANLTTTGMGIGTPDYMAPEEALGEKVGPATDIYALGIVFYELVTGHRPFQADTPMAVLLKHLQDPLPRPQTFVPNVPEDVEQALIKALAKQPEDRYASAADFAVALENIAAGQPLSTQVVTRSSRKGSPGLMWGGLAALGAVGLGAVLCLLAVAAFSLYRPGIVARPTPTVPAGFVSVVAVRGDAQSQFGSATPVTLTTGALLPVGAGSRLRTGDGQLQLGLTNGAAAYLGPQSELELTSVADPRGGSTSTLLNLLRGKLLVVVNLAPGTYFAVQAGSGLRAESLGSTLGAEYNPGQQRLDLDCLAGRCRLTSASASLDLAAGQHSWMDAFGGPFAPDAARLGDWAFTGLPLVSASPTPGAAPLLTDTPAPSQTAAPTPSSSPTASSTASPSPSDTDSPTSTRPPATVTRRPATATQAPPTATFRPPTATQPPPTQVPATQPPATQVPTTPSPPTQPPTLTPVPPNPPTSTIVPPV